MNGRCVAHLDMDAFYVSVELLRHPELRGLPVIVAGDGPRSVVTTASYEARKFGVGSAMPSSRAHRLCPQGTFLKPDFPYYRQVSATAMAIVRRHVEQTEQIGLDEIYLDLSGWPAPKAAMRGIVLEIKQRVGLTASVGIGPNKLVAKVASDAEKPHGFVVLTREAACERFAGSPCRVIPGIGRRTAERLERIGIATVGQLREAEPSSLRVAFAASTISYLQALARFEHDGAVSEERKEHSESRERTFDTDIDNAGELERILGVLAGELCVTLQRKGLAGRNVSIKVRLDDFSTHTRARTLPAPINDAAGVGAAALELLRAFAAPRPVRLLGVRVGGLAPIDEDARGQLRLAV
jgi:DNA polymerase-4